MIKPWFTFLAGVTCFFQLPAQSLSPPDTLEQARILAYSGRFQDASQLLAVYCRTGTDVYCLQLQAQVQYWMQDFRGARQLYEQALAAFPETLSLQLDYARFLFETGKLEQAAVQLRQHVQRDSLGAEAQQMLATIDYYRGRNAAAEDRLERLLAQYPDNPAALELLHELRRNTAPYLRLHSQLTGDDQPLQALALSLAGGVYRSWYFHPALSLDTRRFATGQDPASSWHLALGNQWQLSRFGLGLSATGGLFRGGDEAISPTGRVQLSQKILPQAQLELHAERLPYQYTLASAQTSFLHRHYRAALVIDQADSWMGQAAYERQAFDDGNQVNTTYFWLLAPLLRRAPFLLRAGYSYSYADSRRSNFGALETIEDILASGSPDEPIAGDYGLYFTPLRQINHLLLLSVQVQPGKYWQLAARTSICLRAAADNPSLYLDQDEQGRFFITTETFPLRYAPFELEGSLGLSLSEQLQLNASYWFSQLFFFVRHQVGLKFIYHFPP
jgi:tetratricopeptide (TPR) repeat protein